MQSAINEQINFEMFSANTYLSMSAYFAQQGLDGFAHWYYMQYKEELAHAEDMMHYVITRGGKVEIKAVAAVETEFNSPLEIAERLTTTNASSPRRLKTSCASLLKRRICLRRTSSGSTSASRSKKKLTLRTSLTASAWLRMPLSSSSTRSSLHASNPFVPQTTSRQVTRSGYLAARLLYTATAQRGKTNQYWSPLRAVLVTMRSSTGHQ